jgi:hypothetical protein
LSNATHGQQDWVTEIFQAELATGYKGFFIEAGASDGAAGSNTLTLERDFGWNGLLVEPNTKFFQQLCVNRTGICRNVVLADSDRDIDFVQAGWYGAAPDLVKHLFGGEFLESHANYQNDFDGTPATMIKLPARSLGSLLDEVAAPPVIDYFSLDVEGGEPFVLRGIPFDRYRFRVITIETKYSNGETIVNHKHRNTCREILETYGYFLAKELMYDDGYIHENDRGLAGG